MTQFDQITTPRVRPRFGVVGTEFEGDYLLSMLEGLWHTAAELDVDLLIYSVLRTGTPPAFARQFNVNYGFVDDTVLDGLIVLGANLSSYASVTVPLDEVRKRFSHIPTVVVGCEVAGWPSVTVDGYSGFKDLVKHFLVDHGYRHVAMIEGPPESSDACERLQAYLDAHAEAGVTPNPVLRGRGHFDIASGRDQLRRLLDLGVPMDAVVCANDHMAWGCMGLALERGLNLPDDLAVGGFDDIRSYSNARPSLTSVNQDIAEQGAAAMRMLHAQVCGQTPPRDIRLSSRLVKRRSCGCLGLAAANRDEPVSDLRGHVHALMDSMSVPIRLHERLADRLMRLREALAAPGNDQDYQTVLNQIFKLWRGEGLEASLLQNFLLGIQERLLEELAPGAASLAVGRLHRGQVLIANTADLVGDLEHKTVDDTSNLHLKFKTRVTADILESLLSGLAEGLKALEVRTCYVALYQHPVPFESIASVGLPSTSRLVFALDDGELHPEWCEFEYSTCTLLPAAAEAAGQARARALMPFPMFHHNEHFGFIVLERRAQDNFSYEELRHEIAGSLHHSLLVRELDAARELLRLDLERARAANEDLSHIAMRDAMTGVFNRRGFLELAETVMRTARLTHQPMSLIFADMDGLKHINDVYGHEEGDLAICEAARLMQQCFRQEDIVARIGGDEFVALTRSGAADTITMIEQRLARRFTDYNAASTKPYQVACSFGGYLVNADSTESLDEVLAHADRMMYAEKRRRRSQRQGERATGSSTIIADFSPSGSGRLR